MEISYESKDKFGDVITHKKPKDYRKYILFTNVWNEERKVEEMFERVFNFKLRPTLWVWINDGSTDATKYIVDKCIDKYGVSMPTVLINLPTGKNGGLSKIGQTYNTAFDLLGLKDMKSEFEFMSILDVDTIVHPEYYDKVSQGFIVEKHVGVISGAYKRTRQKAPMRSSKAIRWWIVVRMKRFWDPAPDEQLNIEAKSWNQDWLVLDHDAGVVDGKRSRRGRTYNGAFYAGSMWRYVGGSYNGAIQRGLYRMLRRRHGLAFLKGFKENRNYWICEDRKVIKYYKSRSSKFMDRCKGIWVRFAGKRLSK